VVYIICIHIHTCTHTSKLFLNICNGRRFREFPWLIFRNSNVHIPRLTSVTLNFSLLPRHTTGLFLYKFEIVGGGEF
jgi:hypothetical protein